MPICGGAICTNCQPPPCGGIEAWSDALCSCVIYTSPIIIDTDGKGFHLSSAAEGVQFDFLGNGTMMQLGWPVAGSSNGWLALDRNGNGKVDDAGELFGNVTAQPPNKHPNGFAALAVFDLNQDGVIDSQDAVWPNLLVWIDANHDGVSQPGELHSLDEIGIKAISVGYKGTPYTDQYGNKFRYKGQLVPAKADTVDRVIYDVFLVSAQPVG